MKIPRYLLRLLRQKSTWKGIFVFLNSLGIYLAPEQQDIFLGLLSIFSAREITRNDFPEDRI